MWSYVGPLLISLEIKNSTKIIKNSSVAILGQVNPPGDIGLFKPWHHGLQPLAQ